jgi:hypothetical protein
MGFCGREQRSVARDHPDWRESCIGDGFLWEGATLTYVFDFGDNWKFHLVLERIEPGKPKQKKPILLESHGQAPEQYPRWDDEE